MPMVIEDFGGIDDSFIPDAPDAEAIPLAAGIAAHRNVFPIQATTPCRSRIVFR
jgi:hypothetical protein